MKRLQIYVDDPLFAEIDRRAREKGIPVSSEIMPVLEKYYLEKAEFKASKPAAEAVSFDEILTKVANEVTAFIAANKHSAKEFTLYEMSPYFFSLSMAEDDRLTGLKPRIGKAFRSMVDTGIIAGLTPVMSHGRQKRKNNAALYEMKGE